MNTATQPIDFDRRNVGNVMDQKTNLILYLVAALSGGLGGCGAAAATVLRGKEVSLVVVISHLIIGVVVGVIMGAFVLAYSQFSGLEAALHDVVMAAGASGLAASVGLALANKMSKIVLKFRGVEVQFTLREGDVERRGNNGTN